MNRLLAISDIHGEFERLESVLEKAQYNTVEDTIVFLGDYIDRGPDSYKVVQYVRELKVNFPTNVVLLKGNHEDMALKYIQGDIDYRLYCYNGGNKTNESYIIADIKDNYAQKQINDFHWLNNLPLYHETDKFLFVHAGIRSDMAIEDQSEKTLLWIRNEFLQNDWQDYGKVIVHGHTPISENINIKEMYITKRLNIDTGAGKGGMLSLVDLTNEKIYQA